MAYQTTLDFKRRNAIAARLDDVVIAALEPEVAVLIARQHVTGVVPRAAKDLLRPFGFPPVFLHHARMRIAAHTQRAVLPNGYRLKVVVEQFDNRARGRPAAASRFERRAEH